MADATTRERLPSSLRSRWAPGRALGWEGVWARSDAREAAGRRSGRTGERELKLAERAEPPASAAAAGRLTPSRARRAAGGGGQAGGGAGGAGEAEAEAVSPRAAQALLAPCWSVLGALLWRFSDPGLLLTRSRRREGGVRGGGGERAAAAAADPGPEKEAEWEPPQPPRPPPPAAAGLLRVLSRLEGTRGALNMPRTGS